MPLPAGKASSLSPHPPAFPFRRPAPASFGTLPRPRTADGAPRLVGIEIEFMRLGAGRAAHALAAGLGGHVAGEDAHAFRVLGTEFGDLAVELDLRHAHPQRHRHMLPLPLPFRLGRRGAALLGHMLGAAVPCELITRPLPPDRLPDLARAVGILRRAGAGGPRLPLAGAPGLHFNVDVPRPDATTLTASLKAFLLLDPWLRRACAARPGRPASLPPRYPEDYVRRIVEPGYGPPLPRFTDDYLAANPTRDRGLDLLPVLLHLDEARVRARLPNEKIGGRPAFHYRLPQAHVGEEEWTMAPDWNRWVAVERLAGDDSGLAELGRAYLGFRGGGESWADLIGTMVADAKG